MNRLLKALLACGLVFVPLGPSYAGGKGKGGGKGGGHGHGHGRGGGGGPGWSGGLPPGQVRNAVLGSAFAPGFGGGYYPNYYPNNYYPGYYPGPYPYYHNNNNSFWPGVGVGLAVGTLLNNVPLRSFGGYSPYYYSDGAIVPYGYSGTYSAPGTAAVLGLPAVVDPTVTYSAPAVVDPAVPQPMAIPAPTPAPTGATPVHVTVRVPDGAQVWVADAPSNQTGPTQEFVSPPVEPGADYTYVVRAKWTENGQPVERTKRVTVRAGDRVTVDMTQPE